MSSPPIVLHCPRSNRARMAEIRTNVSVTMEAIAQETAKVAAAGTAAEAKEHRQRILQLRESVASQRVEPIAAAQYRIVGHDAVAGLSGNGHEQQRKEAAEMRAPAEFHAVVPEGWQKWVCYQALCEVHGEVRVLATEPPTRCTCSRELREQRAIAVGATQRALPVVQVIGWCSNYAASFVANLRGSLLAQLEDEPPHPRTPVNRHHCRPLEKRHTGVRRVLGVLQQHTGEWLTRDELAKLAAVPDSAPYVCRLRNEMGVHIEADFSTVTLEGKRCRRALYRLAAQPQSGSNLR